MSDNKRFPLNYRGIHVEELWGAKDKNIILENTMQNRQCSTKTITAVKQNTQKD